MIHVRSSKNLDGSFMNYWVPEADTEHVFLSKSTPRRVDVWLEGAQIRDRRTYHRCRRLGSLRSTTCDSASPLSTRRRWSRADSIRSVPRSGVSRDLDLTSRGGWVAADCILYTFKLQFDEGIHKCLLSISMYFNYQCKYKLKCCWSN